MAHAPKLTHFTPLLLALLLALFAPPLYAQDETPPPVEGPVYIVQSGDSLFSIGLAFGVSIPQLQAANNMTDADVLSIDRRLIIPGLTGVEGILATHTVAPGESLASLALVLNNPREDLISLNRMLNPGLLFAGQSLIYVIPEGQSEPDGLSEGRILVARNGDTPLLLAARHGLHPQILNDINSFTHPNLMFAGQRVVVPMAGVPLTGLTGPLLGMTLLPDRPAHGQHVGIRLNVEPGTTVTGTLDQWELPFFSVDDTTQLALQGIYAFTRPGLYPLSLVATAPDGTAADYNVFIAVRDASYQFQQIVVTGETADLLAPELVNAEYRRVADTTTPITPTRYFEGAFQEPAPMFRLTAPFGIRRSYNGGPYDSFHGGLDIGGPSTTPVVAPAGGVIVMAERLSVRGNAVIVDHGWGVYSGYWHLSQITVEVGQQVATGEQLGFIGSTGLSTGNHLHWEIWVNQNQVDPAIWMEYSFP